MALGTVTLLTGETEQGKSVLASKVAACVTTGEALPGGPKMTAAGVAILTAEEHASTDWIPRLERAGADMDRVHFPGWDDDARRRKRYSFPTGADELAARLIDRCVKLLIIDPITSFIDGNLLAESNEAARKVVDWLTELARQAALSVMLIKHPRKGASGAATDQVSGGKEWINAPRFALVVAPHPADRDVRVLAALKNRGPRVPSLAARMDFDDKGTPLWAWKGQTPLTAADVFAGESDPVERNAVEECKALLVAMMDGGARKATELIAKLEANGYLRRCWTQAKKQLRVSSHPVGPNDDRYQEWRKDPEGWPNAPGA